MGGLCTNITCIHMCVQTDMIFNLLCQDQEGNTALHVAVLAHRSEAVRMLMEAGADPTIANHGSFTPILEAAKNGFYAYATI